MAIAQVAGQAGKGYGDNSTTADRAFGSNVAAGSLITIVGIKWVGGGGSDTFVAADCIKQAGTATIGSVSLDVQHQVSDGTDFYSVGIFSCLVTGAGSLTMRLQNMNAGSYSVIFTDEWTGTWDASRVDGTPAATGNATNSQTAASSGNTTSAGAALFIGGLAANASNSGYTMTALNSFTNASTETDGSAHWVGAYAYRVVASGSTLPAAWTISSANQGWAAGVVAYKEAGGGGGGAVLRKNSLMRLGVGR